MHFQNWYKWHVRWNLVACCLHETTLKNHNLDYIRFFSRNTHAELIQKQVSVTVILRRNCCLSERNSIKVCESWTRRGATACCTLQHISLESLSVCSQTPDSSVRCLLLSSFSLLSICLFYICRLFYHLILQHVTMFTSPAFVIVRAQVSVMICPPPPLLFIPPLYICYSLHPAIGILLTLACLIRVRQRKGKKQRPLLLRFPPRVLSLLSNASGFLSPLSHFSVSWITGRSC